MLQVQHPVRGDLFPVGLRVLQPTGKVVLFGAAPGAVDKVKERQGVIVALGHRRPAQVGVIAQEHHRPQGGHVEDGQLIIPVGD